MKLARLRLSNFQSFAEGPTEITFAPITFLIGPNGSGKTAVLQALSRMFSFDHTLRRIQRSDFHVKPASSKVREDEQASELWIEADFEFPELLDKDKKKKHATIPSNFAHMRLESDGGAPTVRIRLDAKVNAEEEIEELLSYVLQSDSLGCPTKKAEVPKHNRNSIQVHYLPARRDPVDHISYSANALLGRVLRAASWGGEAGNVTTFAQKISESLGKNAAVVDVGSRLAKVWSALHRGAFYSNPSISFESSDIDALLRHLTVAFAPGPNEQRVDFTRLGDGQKSLLYLSLVLSVQELGRQVLDGTLKGWDVHKLRPALFTFVAMEEPENSLSPHYLGRVLKELTRFSTFHDAQSVVATHAPSLLKRVDPEKIRYMRLNEKRETVVKSITLPPDSNDAHKFVREAVLAYPELYFARLVILGEGDTEEIVLTRMLQARGSAEDVTSVLVVPLGGRHVNHFWRLLRALGIPYLTLLDLDLARHGGGLGAHYVRS
jgi:putative ATP-dependent endonuclease of the OLD family